METTWLILQTVTEGNLTSSRLALGESIVTSTLLLMKSSVMMIMENTAVAETEDFSRPDIRNMRNLWTQQSEDSRPASASSLEHWLWSASHAETWSLRTRPETWSWSVASAWSVICLTRTLWDWNVQFLFYLWILGWTQEQWLFSLVENLIWCLPSITTDISLSWKIFLFRVRWESMINWLVLVLTEDELYKERTL